MRSPLEDGAWHDYDEVLSTQDVAAHEAKAGRGGVFFSRDQTLGRGRFGREWISEPDQSLTMSLAYLAYADHPRPYLVGMSIAVACAAVLRLEVAWPNDVIAGGRKVGGILTEIVTDDRGRRVPVVGVGLNLNQKAFPQEIADIATSVALYNGGSYSPRAVAEEVVARLATLPEPDGWADVSAVWSLFDHTPGKSYVTHEGDRALALGIGPEGQLICSVDGEMREILAADACFGPSA